MKPANLAARLGRAVRFELQKAAAAPIGRFAVLAVVVVVVGRGYLERHAEKPAASHALLATLAESGLRIATLFALILAARAINEETAAKTLRAVLLRPIGRIEFIVAKFTATGLTAAVLWAAAWVAAYAVTSACGGFKDVVLEIEGFDPVVKFEKARLDDWSIRCALATLPAVLSAAALGTLLSILIGSPGAAVAAAAALFFGAQVAGPAVETPSGSAVPFDAAWILRLLGETAAGIETNTLLFESVTSSPTAALVPLGAAALAGLATAVIFVRRDVTC